jgi:hypothetical protein
MTPQKRSAWNKRISLLCPTDLINVRDMIDARLANGNFDLEIEIATRHMDSSLVFRTIQIKGPRRLQDILCCADRCPSCPHGPFWFRYNSNGELLYFTGHSPALPPNILNEMESECKDPIGFYELKPPTQI